MKSNVLGSWNNMKVSMLLYGGLLAIAVGLLIFAVSIAYGQVLTLQPGENDTQIEIENAATMNFSIYFENGTRVLLDNNETISQDRGDYIVSILNIVLSGAEEDELPTY